MIKKWLKTALLFCMAVILIQCTLINDAISPKNSLAQVTNADQEQEKLPSSPTSDRSNFNDDPQMTPTPSHPSYPALKNLIEKAKKDLAQRLSISVDQINLKKAESVVWPNASLGCPQPGMQYADMLTSGYLISLDAKGQKYEYHASRSTVVHCKNPSPPVSGTPPDQ